MTNTLLPILNPPLSPASPPAGPEPDFDAPAPASISDPAPGPEEHISRPPVLLTLGHATAVTTGADASPVSVGAAPAPWTTANPPSSSRTGPLGPGDIEMDSVTPAGHRRRRSSLINPANSSGSRHRSPRPKSLSTRTPANGDDDDKIVEESSDDSSSLQPGEVDEDDLTDEDLHDDEEAGLTGQDKRRKWRKRKRNQLLDQRIVRDHAISEEEEKEADLNVFRTAVVNIVLIGLWYFFSLLISLVWTRSPAIP